jgi:hypothetical protein
MFGQHRRRLAEAKVAAPVSQISTELRDYHFHLNSRVRRVSSLTRCLNRTIAFGAIRRFGSRCQVKLKLRNFHLQGGNYRM